MQTDNVACDVEFALAVADAEPIKVGANLRYETRDPFAVCVSFESGTERIDWTFARELLDDGLWQATGEGDVKVWPHGGAVFLALCSPSGRAVLETSRPAVAAFVARTRQLVPAGHEGEFVNFDDELDDLLL